MYFVLIYKDIQNIFHTIYIDLNSALYQYAFGDYCSLVTHNFHLDQQKKLNESFKVLSEHVKTHSERTNLLLIIILIVIIVHFVFLIVENRFKLITKFFENAIDPKTRYRYRVLQRRKIRAAIFTDSPIQLIQKDLESIRNLIENKSIQTTVTKFKIREENFIELILTENDSIVSIKKQICDQWSDAKPYSFKLMKLKYDNTILDDNQFLLPCLLRRECVVQCVMDEVVDHNQFFIIKLKSNISIPDLFQIKRDQTIYQLKQIIQKFEKSNDIFIIKNDQKLEDEYRMDSILRNDDDWLLVVKREWGNLKIQSIFDDRESLVIDYCNMDSISFLIKKIANKFNTNEENVFLFINEECLEETKLIYDYRINEQSEIKYYYLLNLNEIELEESPFEYGYISQMFQAEHRISKKKLYVQKLFQVKTKENIKRIVQYQIFKSSKIFFPFSIYRKDQTVYFAIDQIVGVTLTQYVQNNSIKIPDSQIAKWSKQILEYLQHFYDNGYIYGDLKPYELFIDEKKNIKLLNSPAQMIYKQESSTIIDEIPKSNSVPLIYLAPEIRKKKYCGHSVDVWSFGIILIFIINGECPNDDNVDTSSGSLKYNFPKDRDNTLKQFIDLCLKIDPKNRSSIYKLLNHDFIKNI